METTTRVVTKGIVKGTGRKAIRAAKKTLNSEVTITKNKMNRSARKAAARFNSSQRAKMAEHAIKGASTVAATTAVTSALGNAMKAPYGMFGEDKDDDN